MFQPDQPDNEEDVDREIRIEKMKRELDDLAHGSMISSGFGEMPRTVEEIFLARALEFERAEFDTSFNRLIQRGLVMEPPDELDDAALRAKLHEILRALATMNCFI